MENLELRRKVAEAMGHKWDESRCRICGWPLAASLKEGCVPGNCCVRPAPGTRSDELPPYELDSHAAMDALMEFCQQRDWVWQTNNHTRKFEAWIYGADLFLGRDDKSLAIAICTAIVSAAKRVIDEREQDAGK